MNPIEHFFPLLFGTTFSLISSWKFSKFNLSFSVLIFLSSNSVIFFTIFSCLFKLFRFKSLLFFSTFSPFFTPNRWKACLFGVPLEFVVSVTLLLLSFFRLKRMVIEELWVGVYLNIFLNRRSDKILLIETPKNFSRRLW